MFCYGQKETWYKELVPSGILPALEFDGEIFTDSDTILWELEKEFGPLGQSLKDREVVKFHRLERQLFRAWCTWICYPVKRQETDDVSKKMFLKVLRAVEKALTKHDGPFFFPEYGIADLIMTPYIERMNASLFYYKGFNMRTDEYPAIQKWFNACEERSVYCGTQSDMHTHAHGLPPQMGGCYPPPELSEQIIANQKAVNSGPWLDGLPDNMHSHVPDDAKQEALNRILRHYKNVIKVNPCEKKAHIDAALRCAVSNMMTGKVIKPPPGTDRFLRFIRDSVNAPRDMSVFAAKHFRTSLEATAALDGDGEDWIIKTDFRKDQDPAPFAKVETTNT